MDYSKFQLEDFVSDEYFVKWVKRPDQENSAFWNAWLSQNPGSTERVRAAREVVLQLDFKPNVAPEGKFLEVWDKIVKADSDNLHSLPHTLIKTSHDKKRVHNRVLLYWIAASVTLLIICSAVFISIRVRTLEISTAFGESRTVSLPDGTKVTLNSNSKISFSPSLLSSGNREVFLEGEAFFSVVHEDNHEKFVVHTGELNLEVLGTKFNVHSRRGQTKVILTEGKVRLNMTSDKKQANLVMAPGEYVVYSKKGELTRKTMDANNYLEWRNNRLIFVGTSLQEIAQMLEDNYGYKVTFQNDSIKNRKFTGSSSAVEIEELLEKLSRVYDLKVDKNGNKVTLKQNEETASETD
jgi:transmembrane sensor